LKEGIEDVKDDPDTCPKLMTEEQLFAYQAQAEQFERLKDKLDPHEQNYWQHVMTDQDHDQLRKRYAEFIEEHPTAQLTYDGWTLTMVKIAYKIWHKEIKPMSPRLQLKIARKALRKANKTMTPDEYRKARAKVEAKFKGGEQ
jgi:hypothetical protein